MKTSTQLKALTRNLAKKNIEAQIILRNYMLESLLERISVSKYNENFILKGGMLIATMVGLDTSSTMYMDTTLKGQTLSEESVHKILTLPVELSVQFIRDGRFVAFASMHLKSAFRIGRL